MSKSHKQPARNLTRNSTSAQSGQPRCKCGQPALPGRRTCGRHGRQRASQTIKTKSIRLDRVLHTFDAREFYADSPVKAVSVKPFPTEQPYLADIAVRENGAVLGLPTTLDGLGRLLADWLRRPGRSLYELETLTPHHLPTRDRAVAIATAADRLVRYDLARSPSPAQAGEGLGWGFA